MNERYFEKKNITLRLPIEIIEHAKTRAEIESRKHHQRVSINSIFMSYIIESYEKETSLMFGNQNKLKINRRITNDVK